MGVNKLWDILLLTAVQKSMADLSGLVLAIDASIWIMKVNYVFSSEKSGQKIQCIFNKILLLMKNNLKPIFVFDGSAPALKRQTLEDRRHRRREYSSVEIRKRVENQLIKKIEGRPSAYATQQKESEERQKQVDETFRQLIGLEDPAQSLDYAEKQKMQNRILDEQYQIYCEIDSSIVDNFGVGESFSGQPIAAKQEILRQIESTEMPMLRLVSRSMTEEEQNVYEMEMIKKRSRIRKLQDQLYRKVLTKKVENGYQIIESIYDGKKVLQKRKVKGPNAGSQWGRAKNTMNNFGQIFGKEGGQEQAEEKDEENEFLSRIFNCRGQPKADEEEPEEAESSAKKVLKKVSEGISKTRGSLDSHQNREDLLAVLEQADGDASSSSPNHSSAPCHEYEEVLRNREEGASNPVHSQDGQEDLDNFPSYVAVEKIDALKTTEQHAQLRNLLDVLGINYLVAPGEAEAQCAALEKMGLVDGVVTEDSDAFLFGARKVYRGVFQDSIKLYSMNAIEKTLSLDQERLIIFAMLLGSDYSQGIKGIGIVNAMEILKIHPTMDSLRKFTQWAKTADVLQEEKHLRTDELLASSTAQDEKEFYELHRKYKNYWHIYPDFPRLSVYEAYKNAEGLERGPSEKAVREKKPMQKEVVEELQLDKFGMSAPQVQHNMRILGRSFNPSHNQTTLDAFVEGSGLAKINSKRLRKAIE